MDPLTALSVAATVVQFVDFSSKLISTGLELHHKSKLDIHVEASLAANDILDYSSQLRRTLPLPDESAALTDDERLLESICEGCEELGRDLLQRLDKLKVPQNNRGRNIWPTLTVAIRSMWTAEDLRSLEERLREYRRQMDSRFIQSLSKRMILQFLALSERFDRLDAANKEIAKDLVIRNASGDLGLQAQISALSALLDQAQAVITSQEQASKRAIADVFQQLGLVSVSQAEDTRVLAQIQKTDRQINQMISNEILESLHFTSITERLEAVDESHRTTFDWIFRRVEDTTQYSEGRRWGDFSNWLQSGAGLYWINGKAGSGKSTLMKYIVSHHQTSALLRRWAGNSKLCTAAFFFWNSGSKQQCSQIGLFRSLLHEILSRNRELIPVVLPVQWTKRYTAACQAENLPSELWRLSTLQLAFKTLIAQTTVPLKLCLFIDGLDEYEGNDEEIADLFGNTAMSNNVKICCSSRPHQAFEDAFVHCPGLRLQDLTIPDMRQYVHDKLEKNSRMQQLREREPQETKELIDEIGNAADGVFLWVRLVVSSLIRGLGMHDDIWYLRKRLKELPSELDDLFHQMIFKVDKVYQQETAQLFQLVGTGFRDQDATMDFRRYTEQLSVLFLSFASERNTRLALEAKVGFMTKEKVITRCEEMEIRLRTRCGGLLEVQHGKRTTTILPDMKVAYLHRTVKDYLELRDTRQQLINQTIDQSEDPFNPQYAIFKAHILMLKALEATSFTERPPWALMEDAITWARRAEQEHPKIIQPEVFDEFYNVASLLWSEARRFSDVQHEFFQQQESALTLATQCGLHNYLDAKLSQNNEIPSWKGSRSLLDYALVPAREAPNFRSVDVLTILLKYGADPYDERLEVYTRNFGSAPIYYELQASLQQAKERTPPRLKTERSDEKHACCCLVQ